MSVDLGSLPVSGGLIVGCVVYGALSVFVTGPLVGERMIDKSDWHARCERTLKRQTLSRKEPQSERPALRCNQIMFWMGRDGKELCAMAGNPELGHLLDPMAAQRRKARLRKNQRLDRMAARSGSRCGCAAAVVLEEQRYSLALHAGSARLVTPNAIKRFNEELAAALHAPRCAAISKGSAS